MANDDNAKTKAQLIAELVALRAQLAAQTTQAHQPPSMKVDARDARFRALADTAPVLLWRADAHGSRVYFNQSWLAFTGRTLAQEYGDGWASLMHPDDQAEYRDQAHTAWAARQAFRIEYRLRQYNGTYRWLLDTGVPRFEADGSFAGYLGSCVDIDDHKATETALRNQREQLQVTLASIGDAVIVTDPSGHVTFMNPVAQQLTGWSAAEAMGMPLEQIFQIINATTRQPVTSPVSEVLRTGQIVGLANHTVLIAHNGSEIPIDDSGAPIRDAQGTIMGVVLVFRDVTARKQAEAALRASRDQLAVILEGVADAITVQNTNGELVYANTAAARLLGYATAQTLIAAPVREVTKQFTVTDADGAPFPLAQLPGRRVFHGQPGDATVLRFRIQATGVERWSLVQATPVYAPDGTVQLAVNIFRDITEQRRAQETQRFLAQASTVLASSLDYETTLNQVAALAVPQIGDWCGIDLLADDGTLQRVVTMHPDPAMIALAAEMNERYPSDLSDEVGIAQVLRTGQSLFYPHVTDAMIVASARDADQLAFLRTIGFSSVMVVPLIARQHVLGAITFVATTAAHRYTNADLRLAEELAHQAALAVDNARLYRNAQAALKAREVFMSVASHELKTPLTALLGNAQLLQRRVRPGEALGDRDSRTIQVIIEQTRRLNKLVSALLDLSRIENGQLSIEHAPVDLAALAERVTTELGLDDDRQLEIIGTEQPLLVEGDLLRLEQVIQNLLQNAIKYSRPHQPITMRLERQNRTVVLSVRDYGIGIPAQAQAHLFQRFYRAPNVDPQQISGLGIGLYVVREIVALHAGTITVESAEGQGSTFSITLPLLER